MLEAVRVAEAEGASGIVATNTTIERHGLPEVGAGGVRIVQGLDGTREDDLVVEFVKSRAPLLRNLKSPTPGLILCVPVAPAMFMA